MRKINKQKVFMKFAGSLVLLVAFILLTATGSFAQRYFSQVLQTIPYSPKDSVRLNALLHTAKDRNEVSTMLEKTLRSSRIRCYVYVIDKAKGWTVCCYDPNIKQFIDLGDKIIMQSKGGSVCYIGYPGQFKALGDTLILLQPLQLQIGFDTREFPLQDYFISNTRAWKCRLSADTLMLYPTGKISSMQLIELRNSTTPDSLLWGASVRLLDKKSIGELLVFLRGLRHVFPQLAASELENVAGAWFQNRFGTPEGRQLNGWIHQNFDSR